jgi:ribosomal-protein-alanine N-acetyltransferase
MIHFQNIETSRLYLKGLSPEVMNYIFNSHSKSEIMEILGHRSEEDYLKEEHKNKNGYASYNRSFMLFLIIHKKTSQIIGRCGLHNWNDEHKRAEIGYVMDDEQFKRLGLMTEAVGAVIDYGFHVLNLHRIEAMVGTKNTASLKIMEKFHFIQEGLLREHYFISGNYEDSLVFSKLKTEFIGNF